MDWLCWALPMLALTGYGVARLYVYNATKVSHSNSIVSQEMAKLVQQIGSSYLSSDPGEARKDVMRKQYLNLGKAGLTPEDLEWVAEQMKLAGFDPTKKRYATDHRDAYSVGRRHFYPGGR